MVSPPAKLTGAPEQGVPAPAATVAASGVPDFWEWLKAQIEARAKAGTLRRKQHHDLNIHLGYLLRVIRRKTYPMPLDRLDRIGQYYGAPPEWVECWKQRAVERYSVIPGALAMMGVYVAPTVPCATLGCTNTILLCQFEGGLRRCKECGPRRGKGGPQRHDAQNPGMILVDHALHRLGLLRYELSKTIGHNDDFLGRAAAKKAWHPRRQDAEKITAELKVPLNELLAATGGTWEDYQDVRALRLQACLYAHQAARAAENNILANFVRDFLGAKASQLAKKSDKAALEALRDQVFSLAREPHPDSLHAGLKPGDHRPEQFGIDQSTRRREELERLTPEERKEAAAHLHKPVADIKRLARSVAAKKGADYVLQHVDDYAQRAANKHRADGMTLDFSRHIIKSALKTTKRGRTADFKHPHICTLPNTMSWADISEDQRGNREYRDSARVAHLIFHKEAGLPHCTGMSGRKLGAV